MIWIWIAGLTSGVCLALFAPSLRTKSITTRIGVGVAAGVGVTFVINACFEMLSYLRQGLAAPKLFEVADELLGLYRERDFRPEFWAEPLNALTNASFLIAACLAWDFACRRRVNTRTTNVLLSLAALIGLGSFLFHTIPNQLTLWLDVVPIALFQVLFLWLVSSKMLALSRMASVLIVVGVIGSAFVLFPITKPLNGSLFYLPPLLAMLTIGFAWAKRTNSEPYLLVGAACCFILAVTARSLDKEVPWRFGSHFLWHSMNGVVVYIVLRAWIIFAAAQKKMQSSLRRTVNFATPSIANTQHTNKPSQS